ncbi:PEP-CTERM sorting domain-containing protein [Paucibacter sp. KBW04]|uniref:PEP-CTERM sorting domain-containing protein n=1 Tax=Paucibacter sp. KBW04 TaxID=2153361 RepID=UPI000F5701AE|nr:PEP-CTERM sorting domain-containing protein [Paucibacter sp. KBW04]RQO59770.1 PEP-CTERM sorting domain-containing protein [Paucibacter sp. KBW04]
MKKQTIFLTAALSALALTAPAQAAVSVDSSSFVYSQSFDSLAKTTSTSNVAWANDSTLAGWSLFNKDKAAITSYLADAGGSNTGGFRSFGVSGNSDRALGGVGSGGTYFGSPANGAVAGWIALSLTNNSGSALAGFNLAFDGEQWRNGGNATAHSMVLEYGFGASFAAVTSWTAPGANFDWTSPVVGTTAATVNGNGAGLVAGRGGQINTAWAAGDTLWVRWTERNETGNDHGLAIDNVSFSAVAAAVPEPQTYALLLAGLGAIGFVARRRKA